MKTIKSSLAAFLLLILSAHAADKPPSPETAALTERLKSAEDAARVSYLESAVLREQMATQQLEKARADKDAAYAAACKGAGLAVDVKACLPDWAARKMVKPEPTK